MSPPSCASWPTGNGRRSRRSSTRFSGASRRRSRRLSGRRLPESLPSWGRSPQAQPARGRSGGAALRGSGVASPVAVVVPDINLLVFAHNEAAPRHAEARAWWEALMIGREHVGVPWAVAVGFIRLVTHPAVLEEPVPPAAAISRVRQ